MTFKQIATTTLLSTLLLAPAAAFAQDPQGYQPPQGAAAQPADDATVTSFAEAMGEVQVIQQKFSEQLQGVEDNEKARELQMKAQDEMVSAVEASGISVQDYNALASRMDQDPALREKVEKKLQSQ
jgi:hypothetical protein